MAEPANCAINCRRHLQAPFTALNKVDFLLSKKENHHSDTTVDEPSLMVICGTNTWTFLCVCLLNSVIFWIVNLRAVERAAIERLGVYCFFRALPAPSLSSGTQRKTIWMSSLLHQEKGNTIFQWNNWLSPGAVICTRLNRWNENAIILRAKTKMMRLLELIRKIISSDEKIWSAEVSLIYSSNDQLGYCLWYWTICMSWLINDQKIWLLRLNTLGETKRDT